MGQMASNEHTPKKQAKDKDEEIIADDNEEKKSTNDDNEVGIIKKANAPKEKCKNKKAASLFHYECKYHFNKDGSISFYPCPHLEKKEDICTKILAQTKLLQSTKLQDIQRKIGFKEFEAVYDFDATICDEDNSNICAFVTGAIKAFNEHYPFKISPGNIFLLILQAIAINVDQNAEKLRNKYVTHEGKKELVIVRDSRSFILMQQKRDNNWNGVIQEFVEKINKNTLADTVELMEADFSDSTLIDAISNKICVMDICKNYFRYRGFCVPGCGFPKITLSGTKDDWVRLKEKVVILLKKKVTRKFGEMWGKSLIPILDRFINVYDGNIDCLFWNSMIKSGVTVHKLRSSAGTITRRNYWYTGWFNILFPFICDGGYEANGGYKENEQCKPYSMDDNYVNGGLQDAGKAGNDIGVYPLGLASAPVDMLYENANTGKETELKMKFVAGIIGYTQCAKTYEIEPVTGWIIGYNEDEQKKKQNRLYW